MKTKDFYGIGLPGVELSDLPGKLIVIEGADGSGRSTHIELLRNWLEQHGMAVVNTGLKRSTLVSEELTKAKEGNILSPRTMSLFYATDFADLVESQIIPALRAGYIVLADRYIYTLMARDLVRGTPISWLENLYGFAVKPDAVFYLRVSPHLLVERNFQKNLTLDYWESGMDLGLSRDLYESFMKYQRMLLRGFADMQKKFGFVTINGNRSITATQDDLLKRVRKILNE